MGFQGCVATVLRNGGWILQGVGATVPNIEACIPQGLIVTAPADGGWVLWGLGFEVMGRRMTVSGTCSYTHEWGRVW